MFKLMKRTVLVTALMALAGPVTAETNSVTTAWVSAALADKSMHGKIRNPATTATTFVGELVNAVVEVAIEDGALIGANSIETPDGTVANFTADTKFDDFILLSSVTRRDWQLPALNLLLQGGGLTINEVIAATDLLDGPNGPDDVQWAETTNGWVADIGVNNATRLLVNFVGSEPANYALVQFNRRSWAFAQSDPALEYRVAGDYARCAQQALLDSGFNPSGVDGAPGAGARAALAAWADANGVSMPEFTRETASQICFVMTAPEARHADVQQGVTIVYPGAAWNGFTTSTGGLHEFSGIDATLRFADGLMQQVDRLDFGPGIDYRFQNATIDQALTPPWPIVGTVITHGTDAPRWDRLATLLRDDTVGAANAVIDNQGGGFNGLVDDLFVQPDGLDALWTVIGHQSGDDIVLADIVPSRNDPAGGRVVVIFRDGDGGGQLLYAWHNRPGPTGIQMIEDEPPQVADFN